jgi:hypothetical protein
MSLMDPMRVDSLILSETMRKTLLRPYRFRQMLNTKSSSLTRQITQGTTFNSSLGRLLRSLLVIADSSLPATTRTRLSNPSTPDVPSSTLGSREKKKPHWQDPSSSVYRTSWMRRASDMIKKSLQNSLTNTSQIGEESLTNVKDIRLVDRLTLEFFSVDELLKVLKEKNFTEVRKWVVSNLDNDSSVILRRIYDSLYGYITPSSIPAAVLIIAKYQYQIAFVADQEINLLAALTEIMCECEFK